MLQINANTVNVLSELINNVKTLAIAIYVIGLVTFQRYRYALYNTRSYPEYSV